MNESIGEAFPKEQARVRELLGVYRSFPNGVGALGAAALEVILKRADAAAMSGDVVAILRSYQELKGCK